VIKLVDQFRGITAYKVGDEKAILFWSDVWNDHLLQQRFPRLFSFAKDKKISVAQFLQDNHLESQFHLPLSENAHKQYQELQQVISQLQVDESTKDTWHYA
jgi:predicted PP-loop superfamily ATPase